MKSAIIATVLALTGQGVNAWGDVGHRTVAYLAEKYFTPKAAAIYADLLANDQGFDISDASTWADSVKSKMPWSRGFHYINPKGDKPPGNCTVEWPDDCLSKDGCVVSAILNYTSILTDTNNPKIARKNATMFLLHLIGDLHQPLHATGFAKGGNEVEPVCWNKKPNRQTGKCNGDLNLHSVWDSRILHKLRGLPLSLDNAAEKVAAREWADDLYERLENVSNVNMMKDGRVGTEGQCANLSEGAAVGCVLQWTRESNALVCGHVLARGEHWILDGKNDLAEEYYEENKDIAEDQVGKAGVRLAAWLNAIAEEISGEDGDEGLVDDFEKERVLVGDL